MIDERDESLITHNIPDNFADTGRILNGMFKTRNFIEACVLAAPLAGISWFLFSFLPGDAKITLTLLFAALGFAAGIYGIQGDTVFEFFQHVMEFNRNKRYALYNDRVKTDIKPEYLFKDKQQVPMNAFVEKARSILLGVGDDQYDASDIVNQDMSNIIFEENLAATGVPDELKSKKQLKQEAKEKKKREKEAQRIRKLEARRQMLIEQASQDRIREIKREQERAKKKSRKQKR